MITKAFVVASTIATFLSPGAHAAVHYFLIQGNFDTSSPSVETYKWMVDDPNNVLQKGQDVMNAIFGNPGTVSGPVSTTGAGFRVDATYYGTFNPPAYFYEAFTFLGLPGTADDVTLEAVFGDMDNDGLGWGYYNAGGSYTDSFFSNPTFGEYGDGAWYSGQSGTTSRSLLGNGVPETTFDAWVYGADGYASGNAATVQGSENDPLVEDFTGINNLIQQYGNGVSVYSIAAAPEPQRAILFIFGVAAVLGVRRRKVPAIPL